MRISALHDRVVSRRIRTRQKESRNARPMGDASTETHLLKTKSKVVGLPGWRPSTTPKVLLAQVASRYRPPTTEDGRFRQARDPNYDAKMLSLLRALTDHRADILVFPEYS